MVPTGAQIWVAASQVQGCIYVREATASYSLRQNSVTIIRSVNPQVRLVWQKPVGLRARSHHVSTLVRVAMCVPKGVRRASRVAVVCTVPFVWGLLSCKITETRLNRARDG